MNHRNDASGMPELDTDLAAARPQWKTPRVEVLDVASETEAGASGTSDGGIFS